MIFNQIYTHPTPSEHLLEHSSRDLHKIALFSLSFHAITLTCVIFTRISLSIKHSTQSVEIGVRYIQFYRVIHDPFMCLEDSVSAIKFECDVNTIAIASLPLALTVLKQQMFNAFEQPLIFNCSIKA